MTIRVCYNKSMKNTDLQYICTAIGNLSGMPVRLFAGRELRFFHSLVDWPKDPMCLYEEDIFAIENELGYYITPLFYYYGSVRQGTWRIVIGPARRLPAEEKDLRALAFRLDLTGEPADAFVGAMKSILPMPLESVMQLLCVMNYMLNGKKSRLEDVAIYEPEQQGIIRDLEREQAEQQFEDDGEDCPRPEVHNTYAVEQTMMDFVRKGDTAALREWISAAPAVSGGTLAGNQLRQQKNMLVVTATLVSRNAIRGGMDVQDALALSDAYIQKAELLTRVDGLTNLQYRMVTDFTERVERIRLGKHPTKLVVDVANYIRRHLSESITTTQVAEHLYISRSRLSTRFKAEAGMNLCDFILREKTEEAKRLLRYSDKSISAVSSYLGFSSQSYFSHVFRKYTGTTPNEYRDRHAK